MSKEKMEKIEYVSEDGSEKAEDKVKKVKEQLKKAEQERAEYLAGWQRAKADLINYKKEQEARLSEFYKFANEGLILEVLPILDSFELAMKHQKNGGGDGIEQIYKQMKSILKNNSVEEINVIGEKFDPNFHEVVEEIEGKEQGIIAEEIQKGYLLHGKVIRASKVKIGK